MNKSNFNQTGAYPLKTERLQEMQTAYGIFNAFGSLAGDLTIVSGCATIGTTVQNGFVFIAGELLEFKSAVASPTSRVIIIETPVNKSFKNGIVKQVHTLRHATFGTAATSWLWSDFKRGFETKNIPQNLLTQLGSIADKEEKTVVATLSDKIAALETIISNLKVPKILIESSSRPVTNYAGGNNFDSMAYNYVDVFPPTGYTIGNLAGFMASIKQIKFSGNVNGDDSMWCKYAKGPNYVRVTCGASETREVSQVNYMAIWIKY